MKRRPSTVSEGFRSIAKGCKCTGACSLLFLLKSIYSFYTYERAENDIDEKYEITSEYQSCDANRTKAMMICHLSDGCYVRKAAGLINENMW
jgi:hypothetical protein